MRLYKNQFKFFSAVVLAALAGCAHQKSVDRKVDQELQSQPPVSMGGQMAAESRELITESVNLTQGQKDKLLQLHAKMAGEVAALREEEGKLKMVFFKTLLDPKSEEAEISNIKKRILDLDQKKTKRMLSALEEAREILGRQNPDRDRMYRALLLDHEARPGDLF